MSTADFTTAVVDFPSFSPSTLLIIEARGLERRANALLDQARRENACRLAEAACRSTAKALALLDQAESRRAQARRVQA